MLPKHVFRRRIHNLNLDVLMAKSEVEEIFELLSKQKFASDYPTVISDLDSAKLFISTASEKINLARKTMNKYIASKLKGG